MFASFKLYTHSIKTLLRNKKRTLLTIAGIILSVALYLSANTIISVINEKQFANYNNFNPYSIYLNQEVSSEKLNNTIKKYKDVEISFFYESYYYLIDEADNKLSYVNHYAKLVGVNKNFEKYSIPSIDTFDSIESVKLLYGRGFNDDDFLFARNICILNNAFAIKILGNGNPLGKKIRLNQGGEYTVVGILKDTDDIVRSINKMQKNMKNKHSIDENYFSIYIPYTALSKNFQQETTSLIFNFPEIDIETAYKFINKDFPQSNVNNIYYIEKIKNNVKDSTSEISNAIFILMIVMLIMSGISLSIILTFSFKERRYEIAIKKSIGAKGGDILKQFFNEAIHYGFLGGIIGILLGVYLTIIVSPFLLVDIPTIFLNIKQFDLFIPIFASLIISILFSFIPAIIATKQNTIETLRIE